MTGRRSPADWVDPLIGTDSSYEFSNGNTVPAVAMPWGMAAWTPQTQDNGWTYRWRDTAIQGVRLTHQPSPWIGDYGRVTISPQTGTVEADPAARASAFSHDRERATPYAYRVDLDRYDTRVEVTATERCGVLRVTFPATEAAFLLFDTHRDGGALRLDGNRLVGFTASNSGGVPDDFAHHVIVEFDRPVTGFGDALADEIVWDAEALEGDRVCGVVRLDATASRTVEVRIGTSFISDEQAALNLRREVGTLDYNALRGLAKRTWDEHLGVIEIEGATDAQRTTFTTALWRSLLFPRALHEPDETGALRHWSPFAGGVHPGELYTDNGFWDTFRTVYPLLTLLFPERVESVIRGLVHTTREGGWLPKWMSPGYRDCMIGTHAAAVIADAVAKGLRDFDIETAYQAVLQDATVASDNPAVGRRGVERYHALGWVPCDEVSEATSRTLEFAYGDWCVARLAQALGKPEDAARFDARALSYRHVFDPEVGFMRGRRADGSWRPGFDPVEWGGPFTEGSAWHFLWAVPHDPAGLATLLGGRQAMAETLDAVFETPGEFRVGSYGFVIHEMAEMVRGQMGQYAQCNQPIHHALYLYVWAGQPWKTQRRAREVMDRMYQATPDGLPGDEDNGEMSAWYVLSALGLYAVAPGAPVWVLGSPLFERAVLHLPAGDLAVEAPGNGPGSPYVRSVHLGGAEHAASWVPHDALAAGGTLRFEMGPTPNTDRATRVEDAPPSLSPLGP
ncbi:GH92 family glycosyl hydrolase [Rubrivirga sp.]|uniref:GH92 family glycosyl hydrolase n=1 Tax=Rubrivirga sp. TaxID=1885344 RepID=UPI003B519418